MSIAFPALARPECSQEAGDSIDSGMAQPRAALLPSIAASLEYVVSFALFVLALPVLAVAGVLIKLTSRGPVLYRQERVGQDGRVYRVVKLRTMYVGSEKNGACWSVPCDPRVTPVGRVLRRLHLDELPQLWNVLRGEMRLVGPRPERPEFVVKLADRIPHYCVRLRVRPGITGLAQVQRPSDTDLNSVRWKTAYDLWHVRQRTLGLDLRILAGTALKLCGLPFGFIRTLLRFLAPDEVMEAYDDLCSRLTPVHELHPSSGPCIRLPSQANHAPLRGAVELPGERNGFAKHGHADGVSPNRHDGPMPIQPPHLGVEAQRS